MSTVTEHTTSADESPSPAMLSAEVRSQADDLRLIMGLIALAVFVAATVAVAAVAGHLPVITVAAITGAVAFWLGRASHRSAR